MNRFLSNDDTNHSGLHFGISFGDLDLHSKSQEYVKSKNFDVHFLRNFAVNLGEIQYVVTTCWFAEAHTKYNYHKYSRERTVLT